MATGMNRKMRWKISIKLIPKAYGENDPRMLPVLDELLDWYMNTYDDRTHSGGYQNLVISERLSNRMAKILNTKCTPRGPRCSPEIPQN